MKDGQTTPETKGEETKARDTRVPDAMAQVTIRPRREISAAAQRALDEAAERRRLVAEAAARPREIAGRGGAEPVRFGDWEVKGLAVDF